MEVRYYKKKAGSVHRFLVNYTMKLFLPQPDSNQVSIHSEFIVSVLRAADQFYALIVHHQRIFILGFSLHGRSLTMPSPTLWHTFSPPFKIIYFSSFKVRITKSSYIVSLSSTSPSRSICLYLKIFWTSQKMEASITVTGIPPSSTPGARKELVRSPGRTFGINIAAFLA